MATLIRSLYEQMPVADVEDIEVSGWVRTVRDSKAYVFIELNDGTYFKNLQIVCEEGKTENFLDTSHITLGSAIRVEGTLVLTPEMKQPFEIKAKKVEVVGACPGDYPLQKKRHSFEFLRTQAHLRPRTNTFAAVFRIRSLAAQLIHAFFAERDFVYVHTPIITASDAEGAGEMFQVTTLDLNHLPKNPDGTVNEKEDFFGKETNLTVSGQLNGEAYALAFRNIYTFGPTFRAEKSNTPRHAAEFWMIEPEIAFADLFDEMQLVEETLKYVTAGILEKAKPEIAFLNQFVDKNIITRLEGLVKEEFAKISYTDAIDILEKSGKSFEFPVHWGMDLQTEHERYLAEVHYQKPVFVYDYPKDIKAFYMRLNDDGKTVAASDLLVSGIGELVGGSQREERLDVLEKRISEMDQDQESYWWYLELRKYGGVPHAGFGIGFERLIMYLTGMSNIRDVTPFPRTTGSADF
ncbi:MAG: asparagine--tRNA ligase [Clostridiales bacterium]|nr:asparagine--tRNA ligase [Clostridiales bacterium]